jgi:uncharacterized membrane protein
VDKKEAPIMEVYRGPNESRNTPRGNLQTAFAAIPTVATEFNIEARCSAGNESNNPESIKTGRKAVHPQATPDARSTCEEANEKRKCLLAKETSCTSGMSMAESQKGITINL